MAATTPNAIVNSVVAVPAVSLRINHWLHPRVMLHHRSTSGATIQCRLGYLDRSASSAHLTSSARTALSARLEPKLHFAWFLPPSPTPRARLTKLASRLHCASPASCRALAPVPRSPALRTGTHTHATVGPRARVPRFLASRNHYHSSSRLVHFGAVVMRAGVPCMRARWTEPIPHLRPPASRARVGPAPAPLPCRAAAVARALRGDSPAVAACLPSPVSLARLDGNEDGYPDATRTSRASMGTEVEKKEIQLETEMPPRGEGELVGGGGGEGASLEEPGTDT
ncbi:hypothetical protein B0H13DRAFT_2368553 [Mycena leptocephala]|nr:hypothetical protein B0H13DRAFT_2368553 [Mycena leptocephala]